MKMKLDPMYTYTIPYITNTSYLINFENNLDFDSLSILPFNTFENNEYVNFVFN